MAEILKEIWTGEMIKAFREPKENLGWYDRIRSFDQYVDNDVIHFTELGGDPNVLVNNTTYPLNIQELSDTDKPISLDKFDTTATPVTDDELHAISYDKMASVLERHREALEAKVLAKAMHAIAPEKCIEAEGDFTFASLLALKKQFDKWKTPREGRILVLCPDHANALLATEQLFAQAYNLDKVNGRIGRFFGFDIYEYNDTPVYSSKNKGAFGSDAGAPSSVAFYAPAMMKANGSVQFYASEAASDPLYHRNLVNFRKWGICLPLKEEKTRLAIV